MKRQISISIFLAILVIILALLYVKFYNDNKQNEDGVLTEETRKETDEALTISQEYIFYPFYIKDEDGRLVVYETKTKSIYAQTGIETKTLPLEIQKRLESGIFFETEEELYNFLESYSS